MFTPSCVSAPLAVWWSPQAAPAATSQQPCTPADEPEPCAIIDVADLAAPAAAAHLPDAAGPHESKLPATPAGASPRASTTQLRGTLVTAAEHHHHQSEPDGWVIWCNTMPLYHGQGVMPLYHGQFTKWITCKRHPITHPCGWAMCNFQTRISDEYLVHFACNCPKVNAIGLHQWCHRIFCLRSGDGLVPSDSNSLTGLEFTEFSDDYDVTRPQWDNTNAKYAL